MKNFKKIAAMASALTLAACAVAPSMAWAAEDSDPSTSTISIKNQTEDTLVDASFKFYKILDLEVKVNGSGDKETLSYKYTVPSKYKSILQDLTCKSTDDDIIDYISKLTTSAGIKDFAGMLYDDIIAGSLDADVTTTSGLYENAAQGYYLAVEVDSNGNKMSSVMLDTNGKDATTIYLKAAGQPGFEKFIKDKNDSTGDVSDWCKSADHDFTDQVPFRLAASLPSDFADYNEYRLVYHDDLNWNSTNAEAELSANITITKVYIDVTNSGAFISGDVKIPAYDATEAPDGYVLIKNTTAVSETDGAGSNVTTDFTVTIPDVKKYMPAYDASDLGNIRVVVEYTTELTSNAVIGSAGNWNSAFLEYSNCPSSTGQGENTPTNKTPLSSTVVFTYKTDVSKVDPQLNPLTGAIFTLEKFVQSNTGTSTVDGTDADADTLAANKGYWVRIDEVSTNDSDDKFEFKGLDDGTYRLTETVTPEGYKGLDAPVYFTVNPTHNTSASEGADGASVLTALDATVNSSNTTVIANIDEGKIPTVVDDGDITPLITNTLLSKLPNTGGIGTTIFYVTGGAMVALGGVFLITKKRMGRKEG